MQITDLPTRIASKIEQEPTSGCWLWIGAINSCGYGSVYFDGGARGAHRVVYSALIGVVPEGLQVDHLCRNRACVSPWHLEAVTRSTNCRRGDTGIVAKRTKGAQTACLRGHPFDEANTLVHVDADGYVHRRCLACQRARSAAA